MTAAMREDDITRPETWYAVAITVSYMALVFISGEIQMGYGLLLAWPLSELFIAAEARIARRRRLTAQMRRVRRYHALVAPPR
jgi:hypothetical protein